MGTQKILIGVVVLFAVATLGYAALSGKSAQKDDVMMDKEEGEMMDKDAAMNGGSVEADGAVMEKKDEAMKKDEGAMMDDANTMMKHGSYEAYAVSKLAKAEQGDVVLFFRASWCPTCKALDADIRSHLSAIPAGLTILDVEYDNSAELKKQYGVTYQHTFVQVASDGTLIKKWSGSPTLAALAAQVQ